MSGDDHDAYLALAAARFSDQEIYDRWADAGEGLSKEKPDAWRVAFNQLTEMFDNMPERVRTLTLDNWCEMGGQLISAGRREMVFVLATNALMTLRAPTVRPPKRKSGHGYGAA